MLQIARNVTDAQSGALHAKRYLIIDRDTKYSQQFRRLVQDSGTKVIRLPPMSPNLKAYVSHCTSFAGSETTLASVAPEREFGALCFAWRVSTWRFE